MCLCILQGFSQCTGNLGDNIFLDGDFGSGAANILTPDPQIAPGYNYAFNPPPNDGSYTITNNTGPWGGFATNAWVNIRDNSDDPNGYMMVVNASFEPSLFYENLVEGLCENTLYVFSADFYNLVNGLNQINPNVSFLLDGVEVFESGNIVESDNWQTIGFTFATGPGQTSLRLALRNNAPGGLGNDLALDNISFRACGPEALILPEEVANICEDGSPLEIEATIIGDQYDTPVVQWQQSFDQGLTWQDLPGENGLSLVHTDLSSGMFYYRYLLANDPDNLMNSFCRVNSNVKIINVVPKFWTIVDTLCDGLSFELNNNLFFETGIYTDSLISSVGCDSIVTLDLTIVPDANIEAVFDVAEPTCADFDDGQISIETILNGQAPYSIFINEEPHPTGNINALEVGAYQYFIEDVFGCSFESTINLQDPPPFTVDIGPDREVELGCDPIRINSIVSQPASNFIWSTMDTINCDTNCERIEWLPSNSQTLTLTASTADGQCFASDSLFVEVVKVRKVYIPNTFSPNFDGINDVFSIQGAVPNVKVIEKFSVYNRWGALLYEGKDLMPNDLVSGWDGTIDGEKVNAGVYFYSAVIRFLDDEILLYKGNVTLQK